MVNLTKEDKLFNKLLKEFIPPNDYSHLSAVSHSQYRSEHLLSAGDDKKLEFTTHLVEAMIKAIRCYLEKLRGDQKNINIKIVGPGQMSR